MLLRQKQSLPNRLETTNEALKVESIEPLLFVQWIVIQRLVFRVRTSG